jgi:predicted GNAT family N-acyltransferase
MTDVQVKLATTAEERERAFALRHEVFVVEQRVPAKLERDAYDASADHAIAVERGGCVLATGRLVALDARRGKVGRMAVAASRRGEGLGAMVLAELERAARARGLREVVLHAQLSAKGFYERLGYLAEGAVFEEAGIAHVTMRKPLS